MASSIAQRPSCFFAEREESEIRGQNGLRRGRVDTDSALVFNDAFQPDVFHAALASDRIIFAENARDPKFAAKLPAWWRDSLSAATGFIIVPLTVNRQAVCFIYGDWGDTAPNVKPSPAEFAILNDLRALLTQAAERRQATTTASAPATH